MVEGLTDKMGGRARWVVHNLVAHPLLVLCPPLGRWLHDRTAPPPEVLYERIVCPECHGRGEWMAGREDASGMLYEEYETCSYCHVSGSVLVPVKTEAE